jgi:hypothetical protein
MKRLWDYWERAVLVSIALIGLMLLGIVALSAWAGHRLEEQIAALRAAGEPTTFADLARPPIPPETTGAVYLSQASADLQAVLGELYDTAYRVRVAARDSCDELPAEPERIRSVFATKPELFGLLEQAANSPDYDPYSTGSAGYAGDDGWGAPSVRMAAEYLCARAQAQLSACQRDEAIHSYIVVFRIARLADHRPGLIGELVADAIVSMAVPHADKVLQAGPISPSEQAALESALVGRDLNDIMRQLLRANRAEELDSMSEMELELGIAGKLFLFKDRDYEQLETIGKCIDFLPYPSWEWWRRADDLAKSSRHGAGGLRRIDDFKTYCSAILNDEARRRSLCVLSAIISHEAAGNLGEPLLESLGLPADTTIDPFTGEPLHVKKRPDGWAIYSVGKDLKDDGGVSNNCFRGPDYGVGLEILPPD